MRSKKFRVPQCLSPMQILARVKRQFQRQRETQKIEQTLLYLNNSFNNNIQFQQIFIDIKKAKKDSIKSKQLKTIYHLISQNKANYLLFQKIIDTDIQNSNQEKEFNETSTSKWTQVKPGLTQIIQEQQLQTLVNIKTKNQLQSQNTKGSDSQLNEKKSNNSKKKRQNSSINSLTVQSNQNSEESKFLIKRIYCRLMEKILVKVAFYTMNKKFLDFIAPNILDLTKNLEIMIRRLENIKDLKFLQQIVMKIYRQNLIIENKIYQLLVDGGFIMSIDQFYRVNGIDVAHKDIYERHLNIENQNEPKKMTNLTLKQKIAQMKNKKERQNIVKKDFIDRTNQEINKKYLQCISQIKIIIKEQQKVQKKNVQKIQEIQFQPQHQRKVNFKRTRMSMSKTLPIMKQMPNLVMQKQIRISAKIPNNIVQQKQQIIRDSNSSDSQPKAKSKEYFIKKPTPNHKTFLNYLGRQSTFSPQFTKLINSSVTSPTKLQRNSITLSQKFLQFNNPIKKPRKQSNDFSQSEQSFSTLHDKSQSRLKKKSSQFYESFPMSKLLKLYQRKKIDRYSIDHFLGSNVLIPNDVRQGLKQELLKLQHIYDPNQKRQQKNSSTLSSKDGGDKSSQNKQTIKNQEQFQNQEQLSLNVSLRKTNSMEQKPSASNQEYILQNSTRKINLKKPKTVNQHSNKKLRNQQSLIKLEKDRYQNLQSFQRIASKNFSIFTMDGVKNLCSYDKQSHFKNQRLKKIPYIKIKGNQIQDALQQKQQNLTKKTTSMTEGISFKSCLQTDNYSTYVENIQKTIDQVVNLTMTPYIRASNNSNKICQKVKSPQKTLICFKNQVKPQLRTRQERFQTYDPKLITQISKNIFDQKQKLFLRSKKINTTEYKHKLNNSQPISPCFSPDKQNSTKSSFQVYDTRHNKKIAK